MGKYTPLILISSFVLVVFVSYFALNLSQEPAQQYSCNKFPRIENGVCKEAVKLASEKYPGTVQQIQKAQISVPTGTPPNIKFVQQEVWIVGIDLDEPIKGALGDISKINVFFSVDEKKILNVVEAV